MNTPLRRVTRLMTGIAAAGIVTTTLLTPTTSAQAAAAPNCTTERGTVTTARADLADTRDEYGDAKGDREDAKAAYDNGQGTLATLNARRRDFAAAKDALLAARVVQADARSAYINCQKPAGIAFEPVDASQNTGRYVFGWTDMPTIEVYLFINNGGGYGPLGYIQNSPDQGEVLFGVNCEALGTGPTAEFSIWTRIDVIYPQNGDPYAVPVGTKLAETTARNVCVPA